jgi:hypothetical protein
VFLAQPCACQILLVPEKILQLFLRVTEAGGFKLHAQVNRVSPPSLDVLFDRHGPQRFLQGWQGKRRTAIARHVDMKLTMHMWYYVQMITERAKIVLYSFDISTHGSMYKKILNKQICCI